MSRKSKKKNRSTPAVLIMCTVLVVSSILLYNHKSDKTSVVPPSATQAAASNAFSATESENNDNSSANTDTLVSDGLQVEYSKEDSQVQDVSTSANSTITVNTQNNSAQTQQTNVAPPVITDSAPDLLAQASADDEFFKDACFIGNSLVDGLHLYSGVTTCDWLCSTGLSIYNIETQKVGDTTVYDKLSSKQYNKVYILLGINEIGADANNFSSAMSSIVDKVRSYQPNATIYIMSLTPVSLAKSSEGGYFTKDKVLSYNNALHNLCASKGLWYIDCYTPLANSDGYLPSNVTFDGIHLDAATYKQWFDSTIRTHYI